MLLNFFNYISFLPKVFIFRKEQRLKYWVKYLSFFISYSTSQKFFLERNTGLDHASIYHKSYRLLFKVIDTFYFNIKNYFFSFLLLKLFFTYNKLKIVFKKKIVYKIKNRLSFSIKTPSSLVLWDAHKGLNANQRFFFSNNKKILKQMRTISQASSRVLFFVTKLSQKRFIDQVFINCNSFLCVHLENNLITNRYFFYKTLLGFHRERRNIQYPNFAIKKSTPLFNYYLSWNLRTFPIADVFIFRVISFFFKYFVFFFKFYYFVYIKIFNFFQFFSFFKKQLMTLNFIPVTNNIFNLVNVLNFSKLCLLSSFWGLHFFKNFFKNMDWYKTFISNYFSVINKNLKFFATKDFKVMSLSIYFKNFVLLFIDFNKYLYLKKIEIKNIITRTFDYYSLKLQDPIETKKRRDLLNMVMLLNFLPIHLVILFTGSTNKQALRDVYFMGFPVIIISAMEHPRHMSDYGFPGNSFDFDVLYFYSRFLFQFL